MQPTLIPFDKLKPKSGDIVFSNCHDNGWYHYSKKNHLYNVIESIVKFCNIIYPVPSNLDTGRIEIFSKNTEFNFKEI